MKKQKFLKLNQKIIKEKNNFPRTKFSNELLDEYKIFKL